MVTTPTPRLRGVAGGLAVVRTGLAAAVRLRRSRGSSHIPRSGAPENGWFLFGLWQSLDAQGHRNQEAVDVRRRFENAWVHADVELTSSRSVNMEGGGTGPPVICLDPSSPNYPPPPTFRNPRSRPPCIAHSRPGAYDTEPVPTFQNSCFNRGGVPCP